MDAQSVLEARKAAEDAFASGLYCAEAVVSALAKSQGIESDLLPRVATAFCSGMARTCGTCGALTGAVMGIRKRCSGLPATAASVKSGVS